MSTRLLAQLTRATISTFEDLGFVLPTPELDEAQAATPLAWHARVRFRGPASGCLDVRISDQVAEELAANMLGVDRSVDPAMKRDAIGEIANVVCGNVVPALGMPGDVFDLDAPVLAPIGEAPAAIEDRAVVIDVGLGLGRARLELFLAEAMESAVA